MDIVEALKSGPRTSKELQALTSWNQSRVSRTVRENSRILQISFRRPYLYALAESVFGSDRIHIANVDTYGKNIPRGLLSAIAPNSYFVELLTGASTLLAGNSHNSRFDSLPYFMEDVRPQGFLGKMIAQQLADQSEEFTSDPDYWSEEMLGKYLISNGDDLPGDFVFGFPMMNRLRAEPTVVDRADYPRIAEQTLSGYTGGSSAGGEQQKFTAFISDIESHVIVKFTPAQNDSISTRWKDILVTEFHAQTILSELGYPTAGTKLINDGGRYFLESKRFDRRGKFGRSSMFSLRTVDAEFVGSGGSWPVVLEALCQRGMATYLDLATTIELHEFGRLINNSDMHLGNLSVSIDGDLFSLLPVYDMCSMGFSPKGSEVPDLAFEIPNLSISEENLVSRQKVVDAAKEFWNRVGTDPLASDLMREFIKSLEFDKKIDEQTQS